MFKTLMVDLFSKLVRCLHLYKLVLLSGVYDNFSWVKKPPKVMILGSSFALTGVIPKEIARINPQYKENEIVNLAQSMGGAYEMYVGLARHKPLLRELEYVYVSIDPHILGEKFYHYMQVEKQFVTMKQWNYLFEHHTHYMEKYHPEIKLSFLTPIAFFLDMFHKKMTKSPLFNGYQPRFHQEVKLFDDQKVKEYTFEPLELFPVSSFAVSYLQKIQSLIQKNSNAKIRYLLFPSYDWYDGYAKYCQEYDTQLVALLQQKLGNIVILGSLSKENFQLNKYDFSDNRHLSHTGALKFTNTIFTEIQRVYTPSAIKPLYHYIAPSSKSLKVDSLNANLELLQMRLNRFLEHKDKIILYGFTNLSRCVMSLIGAKIKQCKICDSSSDLKTAPEFLIDNFIEPKQMLHLHILKKEPFDTLIVCNFLDYNSQYKLLQPFIDDEDLIFPIDYVGFDAQYFHMQINVLFNIVAYVREHFHQIYIIGKSKSLLLLQELLNKTKTVVFVSKEQLLEDEDIGIGINSAYVIDEDDVVENTLECQYGIAKEQIIVMRY